MAVGLAFNLLIIRSHRDSQVESSAGAGGAAGGGAGATTRTLNFRRRTIRGSSQSFPDDEDDDDSQRSRKHDASLRRFGSETSTSKHEEEGELEGENYILTGVHARGRKDEESNYPSYAHTRSP